MKAGLADFYSHTPCGVQPSILDALGRCTAFLLTHPLRGATLSSVVTINIDGISTHTPLAGCNIRGLNTYLMRIDFYSHTPCGVQLAKNIRKCFVIIFLLTHPLRGATNAENIQSILITFLLTHPLRGATKNGIGACAFFPFLLTHPLRGATKIYPGISNGYQFLLTHPLRGATDMKQKIEHYSYISTHTPLAGCNNNVDGRMYCSNYFYSHTPCGVQQQGTNNNRRKKEFLLTHPLRGATVLS